MSEIMTPKANVILYKAGKTYNQGDKIRPADAEFFDAKKMMKLSDFEKEKQKEAKKEQKKAEKIQAKPDDSQE